MFFSTVNVCVSSCVSVMSLAFSHAIYDFITLSGGKQKRNFICSLQIDVNAKLFPMVVSSMEPMMKEIDSKRGEEKEEEKNT